MGESSKGNSKRKFYIGIDQLASTGFPDVSGKLPPLLLPCRRFRKGLMVTDGVFMAIGQSYLKL